MSRLLQYLGIALVLASCAGSSDTDSSLPAQLYDAPIFVAVSTGDGYTINAVTGDSIQNPISNLGETLITGKQVSIVGKKISSNDLEMPETVDLVMPKKYLNELNVHTVPEDISVIEANKNSLVPIKISEVVSDFVCLSVSGDTIPTGIPILTKGEKVPTRQPLPIKAKAPTLSHNAINNMQFLDVDHGLAGSYVPTMLQDKKGNMWFGTFGGGLSRYNGETFTNYTEKEGLASNRIYAILEDQKGHIWICTYGGGVNVFNGEYFIRFTEEEGLCSNNTRSIMEDSKGNIWIGTDGGGVSMYDGKAFTNYSTKEGLPDNYVRTILEDSNGAVWIGTTYNGLCKLNQKGIDKVENQTFTYYNEKNGLVGNHINQIIEDKIGNFWIACNGDGVSKLNFNNDKVTYTNYTVKEGLCGKNVYSLLEDLNGNIWIGTYSDGLSHLVVGGSEDDVDESFTNYSKEEGLSSDEIYFIKADSDGNIWFCTWGSGITIYKPNSFTHLTTNDGLPHIRVYDIQEDRNESLWITTDGGGASKLTLGGVQGKSVTSVTNITKNEGLTHNSPNDILKDREGSIWFSGGRDVSVISQHDNNSITPTRLTNFYEKNGLTDMNVNYIAEDSLGNYWFATEGGICMMTWDIGSTEGACVQYTEEMGLNSNSVSSILQDKKGNYWFGTDLGLNKLSLGNKENASTDSLLAYTEKEGLIHNDVKTILEDNNGNIWIGTHNGLSILHLDDSPSPKEIFTHYTEEQGLTNNLVTSLISDSNGDVWVGTDLGLNKFVLNREYGIEGSNKQHDYVKEIKTYGKQDGLIGEDFIKKSVFLDSKNQIWWGTGKGLSVLSIDKINDSQDPPLVQVNSVEINEQFIDFHNYDQNDSSGFSYSAVQPFYNFPEDLNLNHDKNHLTFNFSAVDWIAPHKIKYSYRLKGLNSNWSKANKEAKTDYRNIPNGSYTFEVRAIGKSNVWSEAFEYNFNVLPPWYFTWWMYVFYSIIAISLIAFYSRWRSKELQRKNEELEKVVSARTEEIQEKNELLNIQTDQLKQLNTAKTQLYNNITHEFRTPLTVIQGMTDILDSNIKNKQFKEADRSLEMIKRNGSKLLQLVNEMLDLAKLEDGSMELQLVQSDVIPVIKYLSESFHSYAEQQGISLTVYSEINSLEMDFDVIKLTSIISNLLSNAIKFTPAKGKIIVHLNKIIHDSEQFLVLKVQDNGIGLSEDDLLNIFDKFYQVNNTSTRAGEGTGIGLSLIKELVELTHGTIHVESSLGAGSTFTVEIPITNDAGRIENVQSVNPGIQYSEIAEKPILSSSVKNGELPLALIIEDNEDVAFYLRKCLAEKYETLHACDGEQGIEMAFKNLPDIIISDVMMPKKDGFEVCATLKSDDLTDHIPIILLTAKATIQDRISGLSHGADAYLAKPFLEAELFTRLDQLVTLRKTMLRKFENNDISQFLRKRLENPDEKFLQKAIKILHEDLSNHSLGASQLALKLHLSESQVYRKLKAISGKSTAIFIRSIRLKKAKELIQTTDKTISEIAYEVGFNDPSWFSKAFKEEFGFSPGAMRK